MGTGEGELAVHDASLTIMKEPDKEGERLGRALNYNIGSTKSWPN
jgi:hypothetical protein